ncbi:MAG: hypothetical protein JWP58_1791 [Hymenobacter sp.]|nr:hypothetical protein [Hymenobacter sp.]
MIVTPAQRETIHTILNRMLAGINDNPGFIFLYDGNRELGISREEGQFLRAVMQSEGLVTNADGPTQNNLSELTAKGYSIARSPGGYRAYTQQQVDKQTQQQKQEQEQINLNRQSATATVSGARSAKVSAWIAALSLVVAIVAVCIAYQATADSTEVSARLQKLEAQVQQLGRNQTTPATSRK